MEQVRRQVEKDFGPQKEESEEEKKKFKQKILAEIRRDNKVSSPKSPQQLLKEIKELSKLISFGRVV